MNKKTYTKMFADCNDVMSVEEMCKALHICRTSAYTLLKQNRIKYIIVGKKYLIPKVALIDFVTSEIKNKSALNVTDAKKGKSKL